jgi:uncharacterized protein YjbI with pentapeptide repeats
LQCANLRGADLTGSEFKGAFVFRSDIADANLATSAIRSVQAGPVWLNGSGPKS